jgi:hypothetical protein
MSDVLEAAKRFATALDAEDYAALEMLLADECRYDSPRGMLLGADVVIDSYRKAASWTKSNIQHVRYQSTARRDSADTAVVTFLDKFEHFGNRHTYTCEQRLHIDTSGRICRIVHIEIPGEREAVDAFLDSIGVRRLFDSYDSKTP